MTDARSGRTALSALVKPVPDARSGRTALEVLIKLNAIAVGPTVSWWDGSALQTAVISGWWDGTTIQSIDTTATGWWDGSAIQSLS